MENCAPSVFPREARQETEEGTILVTLGCLQTETAPETSLHDVCQLLEDIDSGARFMKGILLGALLSGSIWAGILLLML